MRGRREWRRLPVGRVGGHPTYLTDIAVTRDQALRVAVAVGSMEVRDGDRKTVVLRRGGGGTWTVLKSPNPSGYLNQLLGVWSTPSADGAIDTWAVGSYYIGARSAPLIVGYLGCPA